MLQASFSEFAEQTPALYDALIAERDAYMAARLRESAGDARNVLAVVGAQGRLIGILHLHDLLGKGEFRFLI